MMQANTLQSNCYEPAKQYIDLQITQYKVKQHRGDQ